MSDRSLEGERILVPIDGSPQAERALEYALCFPDAEITLFTVINPLDVNPLRPGYQSPIGRTGLPAYSPEWYDELKAEARDLHEQKRKEAANRDVTLSSEIRLGAPARWIVRYAEEQAIDHIVIGSHSRSGASRILLGSVSERVVRRSSAMVTVVR